MYRLLAKLIVFCNLLILPAQSAASQQCNMIGFAGHYMQAYRNRVVLNDCYHRLIGDMDQARRAQQALLALMGGSFELAGYKVGLTDRKAQEMFGLTQPLVGVLFKEMLLPDGAVIEQDSATSLLVELDLMVRVRSAEINQANSIEDIARHIDAIIPFIELPDAMFRLDSQNASALLFAANVGARWGVTGAPLTVVNAQDLIEYLPALTLQLSTATGEVLREGRGSQILGHPLRSILYLLQELALRNETLKPGQLLSLGAIGGPEKAQRGRRYTAEYRGYGDRILSVSVTIR